MNPDTHVALLPWYQAAEPYLVALWVGVVVPVLLAWIGYVMNRFLGVKLSDSANARLQQAAANSAGRIFASLEPAVSRMSIDAHSPLIAAEIPKVQDKVGDAIKTLGITPDVAADHVRDLVAGKLGQLQASAVVGSDAPATPGLPLVIPGAH